MTTTLPLANYSARLEALLDQIDGVTGDEDPACLITISFGLGDAVPAIQFRTAVTDAVPAMIMRFYPMYDNLLTLECAASADDHAPAGSTRWGAALTETGEIEVGLFIKDGPSVEGFDMGDLEASLSYYHPLLGNVDKAVWQARANAAFERAERLAGITPAHAA